MALNVVRMISFTWVQKYDAFSPKKVDFVGLCFTFLLREWRRVFSDGTRAGVFVAFGTRGRR
jgi:hypothetical protein